MNELVWDLSVEMLQQTSWEPRILVSNKSIILNHILASPHTTYGFHGLATKLRVK